MNRIKSIDQQLSPVVASLRFPLTLIVLFIHVLPFEIKAFEASLRAENLFAIFSEGISHFLGASVVPCFFFISAYYFLGKYQTWTWSKYMVDLRKRVSSLLIPFVLWNLLFLVLISLKVWLFDCFGIQGSGERNPLERHSLWELLMMPLDFPLWYVLDLMKVCLLAPVFYFVGRILLGSLSPKIVLSIYLSIYLSIDLLPYTLHLPTTAIFYFGLGSYCALGGLQLLEPLRRCREIVVLAYLVALVCAMIFRVSYTFKVMEFMGIFAFFAMMDWAIPRLPRLVTLFQRLAPATFFVYASHLIYIEPWIKGGFARISFFSSPVGMFVGYLLTPLLTLGVTLCLFYTLRRMAPKVLAVLCGGRD